MPDSFRYRLNSSRERRLKHLCQATGEATKSKALDKAIDHYLRSRGDTPAVPTGNYEQLLTTAENEGSLTAGEIAEQLTTESLPVAYSSEWSVGHDG
jgi:CTP:molybdopterin cytidylyltransferase MocA